MQKTLLNRALLLALPLMTLNTVPANAGVLITSADGVNQQSISPVDFGTVEQGQIEVRKVRITNTGKAPVQVQAPEIQGDDMVFSVNSLCEKPLQPGESCILEIEFFPQDFWGDFSACLTLQINDRDSGLPIKKIPSIQTYGRAFPAH